MRNIQSVCVYCASSSKVDAIYFEAAKQLGKLIARNNLRCIYGAGNQGLMGTIADSVLDAGGKVTGIIPRFMYEEGWHYERLQDIEITNFEIKTSETTPPSRYNSGSIILAMENAGKLIEDEELREQIKGAGIGTSATRAEIIKKLERINYISINTKTQIITPTEKRRKNI